MASIILIGICTYNRNDLLERALEHINKLEIPEECEIRVVISDNNTNKEAYTVYEKFKDYSFKLYYVHEQTPGIAFARNAILQKGIEINADYIAFIDDDEYPEPNWIKELYDVMIEHNASGATSAPTRIANGKVQPLAQRVKRRKRGEKRRTCATSSVLFTIDIVKKSDIWFDTCFGRMTGEDIDFFSRANNLGYTFVWSDKVLIYDELPAQRLTLEWKLDRAFNNGYLKIFLQKKYGKTNFNKNLAKTLFELGFFSILYFIVLFSSKLKNMCLLKIMDCMGKIKSIFSDSPYEHYKRN